MIGRTNAIRRRVVDMSEWRVTLPTSVAPTIAVDREGHVYAAYISVYSYTGAHTYRLKKLAPDGTELWDILAYASVGAVAMDVFDGTIYYTARRASSSATTDTIYKMSADTGAFAGERDAKVGSHKFLRVLGADDFVYDADVSVYRHRMVNGKAISTNLGAHGSMWISCLEVVDGVMYVSGDNGFLRAVDCATGKVVWYLNGLSPSEPLTSSPVTGLAVDVHLKMLRALTDASVSRISFDATCHTRGRKIAPKVYGRVLSGDDGYIYRARRKDNGDCFVTKESGFGSVFSERRFARNTTDLPAVAAVDSGGNLLYVQNRNEIVKCGGAPCL